MRAETQACRRRLDDDQAALIVEVFRMMSDATRVRLLWALTDRELSVTELADTVAKPQTGRQAQFFPKFSTKLEVAKG